MAGNLKFEIRKFRKIFTSSKPDQIQFLNTPFNSKFNEDSENHHNFKF